ncbi:MOSC domain-containing protein [Verrucomicrobia bacterium LW23]|nr:MOSC domain-containing protein [Verrucomicrobia bacterium LW23]
MPQAVHLSRILLFPIKSLDPVEVPAATVTEGGTLRFDREWAMFDGEGKVVNGKRLDRVHLVRAQYDMPGSGDAPLRVTLSSAATSAPRLAVHTLDDAGADGIAAWLSAFLGMPIQLRRNTLHGFPDDLEASGPTLVSSASLHTVADWFTCSGATVGPAFGFDADEARLRFRTNLEIAATPGTGPELPAFWEDRLFAAPGEFVSFRIGAVEFTGSNPCQRCAVPGRDSRTGEATPRFSRLFSDHRKATLPAWSNPQRFNHFYRFAVNTRITPGQAGQVLRQGDALELAGADAES